MPAKTDECIGRNVALKVTNVSQKCGFPSRSSYMRPVIFGNR